MNKEALEKILTDCEDLYEELLFHGHQDRELEDTISDIMFLLVDKLDQIGGTIAKTMPLEDSHGYSSSDDIKQPSPQPELEPNL